MDQNARDCLRQEAQLAATQNAQIALTPEQILSLLDAHDDLLDENRSLLEDVEQLEAEVVGLTATLETGEAE